MLNVSAILKRRSILIILLVAAVLRLWGLDFGLPNDRCRPDEYMIAVVALGMGSGDLNPHFFNYPTLFIYLCFALYSFYFILGYAGGIFHSASDFALAFLIDPTPFYLISRSLSALAGAASVWLIYQLCDRHLHSRFIAVLAALLLAVAPLHVRDSHFGVTDVFMVLMILAALYFTLAFYETGRKNEAIFAAVFAGLSGSAKYTGALILLALGLAIWFRFGKAVLRRQSLTCFGLSLFAFAAAFFLTSPFVLLDMDRFLADFRFEVNHLQAGHLGIDLGRGWFQHLRFSLTYGLGWTFLFAGLVGFYPLLRRHGRKAVLLLCFPLIYYLLIGRGYTVFVRYMLPVIPFLAISAACFIDRLHLHSRWLGAGTVVVILSSCLLQTVQSDRLLAKKDSRLLAAEWFQQNVPNQATVWFSSSVWGIPRLPLAGETIAAVGASSAEIKPALKKLYQQRLDYYQSRKIAVYEQHMNEGDAFVHAALAEWPQWMVVEQSALAGQYRPPAELQTWLSNLYLLRHSVQAADLTDRRNRYDQQDAFYLPLSGFHGIRRPGPNLWIYQKKSNEHH